jgi:hypothetical protein
MTTKQATIQQPLLGDKSCLQQQTNSEWSFIWGLQQEASLCVHCELISVHFVKSWLAENCCGWVEGTVQEARGSETSANGSHSQRTGEDMIRFRRLSACHSELKTENPLTVIVTCSYEGYQSKLRLESIQTRDNTFEGDEEMYERPQ